MTFPGQEAIPLRTGGAIPLVGFGTWRLSGRSSYEAVLHALATGYRHIDTATMYDNETEVGQAMRDSGLGREEIFLTTKLLQDDADNPARAIDASLRRLGTDHVDLWLIHWPPGGRASPKTWEQVLFQRELGKTRAAGVSNYSTGQVDELIAATGDAPTVNQVRWGPAIYDPAFAAESSQRAVVLEGYSPLRSTPLGDPRLVGLAERHEVTPAQVVLRWHIEHRVVVIPRSHNPKRIEQNFDLWGWSLNADEVALLDGLSPMSA
ncbi:MAG TPA: aldo/keto reductase [Acidimicrobiales bacterium]|nr:aldo/keto reductase [Acidimicrobiales bacterium]